MEFRDVGDGLKHRRGVFRVCEDDEVVSLNYGGRFVVNFVLIPERPGSGPHQRFAVFEEWLARCEHDADPFYRVCEFQLGVVKLHSLRDRRDRVVLVYERLEEELLLHVFGLDCRILL